MHNPNEGLLELSESNGAVETTGTPVAVAAPMRTDGIRAERRYGFIPREKFDNINTGKGLRIQRYFTQPGVDPFDTVKWEHRTAVITGERGEVVFEQKDVEVPAFWSQLATNVVASKYFRGQVGTPEREHSVRQVIGRVVETLTRWGREMNYFASDEDADAFRDELKHLLLYQYAAFNSPVWFNVGIEPRAQCSACQPYHAMVNTLYGPMPIGEIVEKNLIGLPVWDGVGLTPVVAVKHNGRKLVYRITLNDGFSVEATGDHLVCAHLNRRTSRLEWRRVDSLKPGMWMRVYPHTPRSFMPEGDEVAVAEAALAGWLQADGFVGQYQNGTNTSLTIEFMTVGQEEFEWVMTHLRRVFPDHHYHIREVETRSSKDRCLRIRLYGEKLRPFVEKYELLRRGVDIRVPRPIWTAPNNVVAAYLRSLFQADGYATVHYPSAHIAFAVISRKWAEEIQLLLTRFGIYARVRQKREKRPDRYNLWEVDISIASERQKFADYIGFVSEAKQSRLRASLQVKGKRCPQVRFQQIIAIEPVGEMDVYDIQTLSGCYLSNAILVHNCFIVSVEDTMESILDLAKTEGMIFKFGSGSGSNLSRIRGSKEYLSGGGRASGPVSFMRGFDSFAGVIKSGGKTRRAAKMVVLNVDHPDIVDFIECKAKEEKKAWALIDAGYDPGFDTPGGAYDSVFFQNANHSVRVTDEFMRAVEEDGEWCTYARTTGEVMGRYKARELFRKIAEAAWVCGDPGLQFHDTTNRWHTVKNSGPINASNPCFTGDSLVYTNKGLIPFRELMMRVAQGESFMVYTHNKTASVPQEGVLLSEPTQFMVTGVNEVWRLRFSNGIEVRCTPNHRFFTLNRGMVRADELTPEDAVLVVDAPCLPVDASWSLPVPSDWRQFRAKGERHAQLNLPTEWSEPFAEMLGHLTGDGSFVPSSTMVILIYGTAEDQEQLLPRHRAVLESLGLRPNISRQANGTVQMRVTRAALNRFLEALGMRRVPAAEKRVPRALFQAPPEIVAAYLRGLFSADGCARDDKTKGTRYIGLGSKSLALLQDVQQLLLMFGIQSRIYTQPPKRAGFRYTRKRDGKQVTYESKGNSYDLRITGPSILRFYHSIGFAVASKQQTLERWVQEHDFYAVRVDAHLVEREFVGYELTYNLTEPRHHTYIVNGLVVANCSEFVFLDDTSCNLASLNLMKFRLPDGSFDVEAFRAAVRIMITAQEIIVDNSAYPTERICDNSHNFRPLGLGYANLGALLMSLGLPYDSDAGRAYAAIITAIMHGEAYRQSAIIARDCGAPFPGFALNREPMLEVIRMHADALNQIQASYVPDHLMKTARAIYDEMLQLGEQYGYRNAQVTVLAPTGTISFMMDCDTTGIEPDIALVKYKTLVGGGLLKIVNTTVPLALQQLGYSAEQIEAITRYIDEHDTIEGAPYLKEEHLPVFDCAFRPAKGTRSLAPMAHVKMMAAVQPFLSGAISKCVTGDTLLFTEKGIIPIRQLYQGEKPDTFRSCTLKVASIDEPQAADMFYYGGFRPTIRLTLQDGRTIEGTPNHRVKVANQHGYGWKRLDEIEMGDFVAIRIGAEMWASENARFDDFQPSAPWGCQKSIKLPREMTPELARLLGYYIAEGSMSRSNWTVRITNNDEGVLQHCQRLLHDLFGLESTIAIDARNGVKSVTVASKTLVEFLEYLGCAGNAAQKQIPWAVLQSRREVVQAFVGALWLDGYIRKDGMVAICLASETLLRQLQVVLNNFGLRANLIRKYSKTVDRFYYELTLFGEDVVRFAALFELDEAHKRERLADAVERANRNAVHSDVVPCFREQMQTILYEQRATQEWRPVFDPRTHHLSHKTVTRFYQSYPLPELKEIVENNIHFVPVVEIEHRFAPVYDLHVPGNHAFLGNAIINHNTVNMPSDTTPEDIENIYMQAWKLGLKAIAIYRDGSKRTQPLSTKKPEEETAPLPVPTERPVRRHLPDERKSITHKFSIAGHEGYITVGMYEDGTPGEIFITMAKEGSVISGLMDAFATAISLALQYGVPLEKLVEKFSYTRFQPSGFTNNPQIPVATSIVDYIFRWLGMKFLQKQPEQKQTLEALEEQPAPPAASAAAQPETVGITGAKEEATRLTPTGQGETMDWSQLVKLQQDAPPCPVCGMIMVRAGACHQCLNCGTSYGCS